MKDETQAPPPPLRLAGLEVDRAEEGAALVVAAFRDTLVDGAEPRISVPSALAASLAGVYAPDGPHGSPAR